MPNWVYNSIKVTGPEDILESFKQKAAEPRPQIINEPTKNEDGTLNWQDTTQVIKWIDNDPICMWNFDYPDDEIIQEYFGKNEKSPYHWYNWNIAHWGTKWDVNHARLHEKEGELFYEFDTPWSPPEVWFAILARDYCELTFHIAYEEEQGWGGCIKISNGKMITTKTWDIPESHADYVERDNVDGCICSWDADEENWYSDCPAQ